MRISERDIKLLWGRAANTCSFPGCRSPLSAISVAGTNDYTIGEQAHIVAEEEAGPRGKSSLSQRDRNTYSNLILLCPKHHAVIDADPDGYPIELLHLYKDQHEVWVQQTLFQNRTREQEATELVYSTLVDAAVEAGRFEEWEYWTSYALCQPPEWDAGMARKLRDFRQRIMAAVWPGKYRELERALQTLSIDLFDAYQEFVRYATREGDKVLGYRWYKPSHLRELTPAEEAELQSKYDAWIDKCAAGVFESTKAANWVAEIVRRDLDPLFFAVQGKFVVTHGPYADFEFLSQVLEYTQDEKDARPDVLLQSSRKS